MQTRTTVVKLETGQVFRVASRVYTLLRLDPGSALVRESAGKQTVNINGREFEARRGSTHRISLGTEVDEILEEQDGQS